MTGIHRPLRPVHVLEAGQLFVIRLLQPDAAPNGRVGVIAERMGLGRIWSGPETTSPAVAARENRVRWSPT